MSVSGPLYDALKTKAAKDGSSQSKIVEDSMRELLGLPVRTMGRPRPPEPANTPKTTIRTVVGTPNKPKVVEPKAVTDANRRQAERDVKARRRAIAEAAEQQRAAKPVDTAGGIFTF